MPVQQQVFELTLSGLSFPGQLPNDKANFRVMAEVRYVKADGAFATERVVVPGLDTFWECATDKATEPNYVRAANAAAIDMTRVDPWDSVMLVFKAAAVHSLKVSVFDVNREDAWDKIKNNLAPVLDAVLSRASTAVPAIGGPLGAILTKDTLGDAAEDVQAFLLKRLAGGDKVLFKGSTGLAAPAPPAVFTQSISGRGTAGDYKVDVTLAVLTSVGSAAAGGRGAAARALPGGVLGE